MVTQSQMFTFKEYKRKQEKSDRYGWPMGICRARASLKKLLSLCHPIIRLFEEAFELFYVLWIKVHTRHKANPSLVLVGSIHSYFWHVECVNHWRSLSGYIWFLHYRAFGFAVVLF